MKTKPLLAICSCFAKIYSRSEMRNHITTNNWTVHKWVYWKGLTEPVKEVGFSFVWDQKFFEEEFCALPQKNWQPYAATAEKEDWKDFRMSVCLTHTWYDNSESLYQVIGSFTAWCNQEVYCIKDYKPGAYLNKIWNYSQYKVVKIDGTGYKIWYFANKDRALEYVRTNCIEDAKCHHVVYNIYYKKTWDIRVSYEGLIVKKYKIDPECKEKQVYCLIATKKQQLEFKNINEGIKYMKEKQAEVLPFRLGTSSEPPMDKDWLKNLVNGTRFLASRRSHEGHELDDFVVSSDPKTLAAVFLGKNLNTREGKFIFVDPSKFSRDYDYFMTLEIIEIQNGNSDPIQAGRMDSDGKPEVISGVHEE